MGNAKWKIEYSVDTDMKQIYRDLYARYKGIVPEIIMYKSLPHRANILYSYGDKNNGLESHLVYMIKEDTEETILRRLHNELDYFYRNYHPKCSKSSFTYFPHTMTNDIVGKWLMFACEIADTLNVMLKPVTFTYLPDIMGYSPKYPTIISQEMSDIEMAASIAHEMRHAWQHDHQPKWIDENNYIHPEDDEDKYKIQPAEIDAEAFGFKVVNELYEMDILFNLTINGRIEQNYSNMIRERMEKIDFTLSKKKKNYLRKLIDVEGQIKQVEDKQ